MPAVMILAILFPGCAKEQADDPSLSAVLSAGKLVIGMDENYPPMGFRDANGDITGFDVDLAKEACKRIGVEAVFQPISWDEKENDLYSGNIDCIWNGLSVNPARQETMRLSESYIKNDVVYVVTGGSGIKSVDDLTGKKIGVQAGSSAEDCLRGAEGPRGSELVTADDNVALFSQLDAGTLDAVAIDSIFAYYYITENGKDYFVLSTVIETEEMAIGFRKPDGALCDKIQETLRTMKGDGTLAQISTKWFGTDVTIVK
ncbi:MAG: amino acid ABC transporter substrate-binding protein [Lachnospiraceae bacterium]|nr:amino acid ABC transporter substrate-binding protein [Lachnospiraceae bacterium]